MTDENSANTPIELPEVLRKELESFGFPATPSDLTKPAEQRLREIHERIRTTQPERSALCLSGGGIRSATFALGVVQALAKAGLLPKFDYLSTVSGGGYLGSMLSAWIHSHPQKLAGVAADLAGACAPGQTTPEVPPLRHLRQFSNYIAPKLGLFSADGWTLVATALRNLLLNWTVLVLILAGLLVLPWLGLLGVLALPTEGQRHALIAAAFLCFACASAYPALDLPSQGNFRWSQRRFVFGWLAPLLAGLLCLCSWWAGVSSEYDYLNLCDADTWIRSVPGKWAVCVFLTGASMAGVMLCCATALWHEMRLGKLRVWPTRAELANTLGITLASIFALGLPGAALLWFLGVHFFANPGSRAVYFITCAPPTLLIGFFILNTLFIGITSRCSDDEDREWFARAAGWLGAVAVGWLFIHGLVFWVPQWIEIYLRPAMQASVAASGGVLGFIAAKIGASARQPAFLENNPNTKKNLLLSGAALVFFALLACGVSLLVDRGLFHQSILHPSLRERFERERREPQNRWRQEHLTFNPASGMLSIPPSAFAAPEAADLFGDPFRPILRVLDDRKSFARFGLLVDPFPEIYFGFARNLGLTLLGFFGTGLVMGYFVNVNRFSLHATYRNRLVRAYLGAARSFTGPDGRPLRQPHPFTGFDADDNLEIASLTHERPLHVVNMTLNLVGGQELAWQERQADSFTATRLHCGNHRLGYRPSDKYADGLSLGTALAISGAAASPNQGYNSSPLLTFLMTLFNVRLGWWLGNPGLRGSHAWKHPGPGQATLPLFTEAFGLTNESRAYVNLSDGGHFENLAIYEMLLRRCRFIVAVDAEQDGDYGFEGLGGIVRKARIDLGTTIEFASLAAVSKDTPEAGRHGFALGQVRYPGGLQGLILYIKPVLQPGLPADVRHYAKTNGAFPHESTGDQFFSESQFEAYRALGQHQMTQIVAPLARTPASIADLFARLEEA